MAKILVTGAAGFIGSQFIELVLASRDLNVIVFDSMKKTAEMLPQSAYSTYVKKIVSSFEKGQSSRG